MELNILSNLLDSAKHVYEDMPNMQFVVVTQAIHESGFLLKSGGSQLALKYNNLFGIKGKGDNGSVSLPTWEEINGKVVHVNANFAVYKSHESAFAAHRRLMEKPRYKRVLEAKTPLEAFRALVLCGYATDGKYSKKLNDIYEKYVKNPTLGSSR